MPGDAVAPEDAELPGNDVLSEDDIVPESSALSANAIAPAPENDTMMELQEPAVSAKTVGKSAPSKGSGLLKKTAKMVPAIQNMLKDDERAEKNAELLKLFNKLHSLSDSLPDERKAEFMKSKNRVQLDFVIAKLEGKPGLLSTAQALRKANFISYGSTEELKAIPLSGQPLANAVVKMMADLSSGFTDESLTTAMDDLSKEIKSKLNVL